MPLGILVVDDSDFMRSRIKSALDSDDFYIVAEAPNGAWAVKLFRKFHEEVDLVMMDIVMKKANGIKATAAIKKLDSSASVIMCTSVGQREKMKLAAKAGADGYLTKPFTDDDILDAIEDVVGRRVSRA
jgi:two-component system chemotaxis response regulator CheY